jgi:mersacidin/lichenicidin family type 2 lantibiotic
MNTVDIIRAWKDEAYRESLTEAERAALPAHPAGMLELNDADLANANGGTLSTIRINTTIFYTMLALGCTLEPSACVNVTCSGPVGSGC